MSVEQFAKLFAGRTDAFGAVWGESIQGEMGDIDWQRHLEGGRDVDSLGIYPMIEDPELSRTWTARLGRPVPDYFVKWGCSDIDDGYEKSLPLARNMQKAAELLSLDLWVERTKGKGYHCWLFADEWVPAEVMRRALLTLHQLAGVRPTEVNPKQLDLSTLKRGLGNYINLPYAASAPEGKRVMIDPEQSVVDVLGLAPIALDWFLDRVRPAQFEQLYEVASIYVAPPKRDTVRIVEPDAEIEQLTKKLSGLAFKIWKEGPLDGRDRSTTLARLAHLMAEGKRDGKTFLTPGEGLKLLRHADSVWGKFHDRVDGEEQLCMMIEKAEW